MKKKTMKLFEIHITGKDETILNYLNDKQLKGISIDLLTPDHTLLRTEHMSSLQQKFESYELCKNWVDELVSDMVSNNIEIVRIKIECPFYEEYASESVYVESHWRVPNDTTCGYPVSRNQGSNKCLATNRTYDKNTYSQFIEQEKGRQVELCMYDSFIEEDYDWFKIYSFV